VQRNSLTETQLQVLKSMTAFLEARWQSNHQCAWQWRASKLWRENWRNCRHWNTAVTL